jgi:hypothetical protein
MSLGPLKKELEAIEQELEAAMLDLSATTERVDALLADFSAGGERRAPAAPIEHFEPPALGGSDTEE